MQKQKIASILLVATCVTSKKEGICTQMHTGIHTDTKSYSRGKRDTQKLSSGC